MRKGILLLIGVFFLCVATRCEREGKPVYTYVTNKTDEIIYVKKTYSGVQIEDVFRFAAFQEIYPDSTVPIETYYVYEDSPNNFHDVEFWIFKKKTFDEHTYREIIENKLVDKWYAFSYKELKSIDFKLKYSGN